MNKEKILISACIYGYPFRYDGKDKKDEKLIKKLKKIYELVPVCPEILSGMGIKRTPCTKVNNKVIDNQTKEDKTHLFLKGAHRALKIAEFLGIKKAFLKEKSPSCGVNLKIVRGVFAELLERKDIKIIGID